MANDFKRMWTKEELKSNSVLDLPDIPEVVDDNSPDIIRVQGKLYYKKEVTKDEVTNLTGTSWKFNETINFYDVDIDHLELDYISNKKTYGDITAIAYGGGIILYSPDDTGHQYYDGKWINEEYRNIEIIGGLYAEDMDIIGFLKVNATLLPLYTYFEVGADEELVKSIPTDVSIIEDQGKLELMLEHDGNVLAINDTPNQFLQRRLDKPSRVITGQDLESLEDNLLPYVNTGTIIKLHETEDYISDNTDNTYCVVDRIESEYGDSYIRLTPFGNYSFTDNLLLYVEVNYLENTFVAHYINFSNGSYNNRTIPNKYLSVSLY